MISATTRQEVVEDTAAETADAKNHKKINILFRIVLSFVLLHIFQINIVLKVTQWVQFLSGHLILNIMLQQDREQILINEFIILERIQTRSFELLVLITKTVQELC